MKNIVILLCLGLIGCPALQSRNEIQTADGRFQASEPQTTNRGVATRAAENASEYQNLLEEVRRLNGQVEELQHRVQQGEQNKNQDSISTRLDAIEKRLISFGETLLLFEQQMNQKMGVNSGASAVKTAPNAGASVSKTSDDPYDAGEALFKKSDWKNAILEFNRYQNNFPKGKNYAEVTYKIGVCFQELNMKDEARTYFDEVISKFSKTKYARSAKYRLNQLKK